MFASRRSLPLASLVALYPLLPVTALAGDPLDEVIVTATRTPQSLRDYAGSVSVVSSADGELVGSTHHSEIINRAAGAKIQRNNGQESLTAIRSPVLSGPGSCGVFLFLENSVPIRPTGFCNVNELFEVNTEQARSIEVLRGPAGVVYGSGAMHGAVNVIQAAPGELPNQSLAPSGFVFASFEPESAPQSPRALKEKLWHAVLSAFYDAGQLLWAHLNEPELATDSPIDRAGQLLRAVIALEDLTEGHVDLALISGQFARLRTNTYHAVDGALCDVLQQLGAFREEVADEVAYGVEVKVAARPHRVEQHRDEPAEVLRAVRLLDDFAEELARQEAHVFGEETEDNAV